MILQQSLARLFNSYWHNYATVAGTILQLSLARVFNSRWHNYSTVAGTTLQQSLARFFNSGWHDSSTITVKIFFFFISWQNSSTVMFTVEEQCHVPGIRHMIPIFICNHNLSTTILSNIVDQTGTLSTAQGRIERINLVNRFHVF